jgi:hypothetical protein
MLQALLLLVLAAGSGADEKSPDIVRLTSGKTLTGRVVQERADALTVESGHAQIEVERQSVAEVRSVERNLATFLKQYDLVPKTSVGHLLDIARFCDDCGLTNEATNLRYRVLLIDANNADARKGLGARSVAEKLQVPDTDGKGWVDFDRLIGPKSRWRDAAELHTAHFLVRTDLPLARVLDAAVQIERHYLRFYDFLGPELGLYVFDQTPEICIYSRPGDYPMPWTEHAKSWYGPAENKLHVLVNDDQFDMVKLVRDVTDMLLVNALRKSSGKMGNMPPWAGCGFSEYFASTAASRPGAAWGELGVPSPALFRRQKDASKPLELDKLLTSSIGDIRRSDAADLRSAGAYTLVHFLLHADDGKYREPFYAYLRDAWTGKISAKGFLKAMGMKEDELETQWNAYVRAKAANG